MTWQTGTERRFMPGARGVLASSSSPAFDVQLFSGTGSAGKIITFSSTPDFVLIKDISNSDGDGTSSYGFWSFGTNASSGATKARKVEGASNAGNAQQITDANSVTSMDTNSITLGDGSGAATVNNSGTDNMIAYAWTNDAAYGVDVIEYTGTGVARTVNHDLGVAPDMIIIQRLDAAGEEWVYHKDLDPTSPQNYGIRINLDNDRSTSATFWNNKAPGTSSFTVGTHANINASGGTYRAILFKGVAGYSKFGTYTGNFSTGQSLTGFGFRPRLFITKRFGGVLDWWILDSKRTQGEGLRFSDNDYYAENTRDATLDADGVTFGSTENVMNINTATYIYMAFA